MKDKLLALKEYCAIRDMKVFDDRLSLVNSCATDEDFDEYFNNKENFDESFADFFLKRHNKEFVSYKADDKCFYFITCGTKFKFLDLVLKVMGRVEDDLRLFIIQDTLVEEIEKYSGDNFKLTEEEVGILETTEMFDSKERLAIKFHTEDDRKRHYNSILNIGKSFADWFVENNPNVITLELDDGDTELYLYVNSGNDLKKVKEMFESVALLYNSVNIYQLKSAVKEFLNNQ